MSGINLQTTIDNDKLVFIDCFSEPFSFNQFQNLPISTTVPNTYSLQSPKKLLKWSNDEQGFASLFEMIQE